MNYRAMSPEERDRRRVARKRKERRRYYPRRKVLQRKWRNEKLLKLLNWHCIPFLATMSPTDDRLHPFQHHATYKARIEEMLDESIYGMQIGTADPYPWFFNAQRQEQIVSPTRKHGEYRQVETPERLIVDNPSHCESIIRLAGLCGALPVRTDGRPTSCPKCWGGRTDSMKVILRPGQDAIYRSWCCGKVRGSWALLGETIRDPVANITAYLLATRQNGCPTAVDFNNVWLGERNLHVDNGLTPGRYFFMAGVLRGKHLSAFGDWARLKGQAFESIHTVGPIANQSFQRKEYLLRILRTFHGEIACVEAYTLGYKPLFVHWFQQPQPVIETPRWCDWFSPNNYLVTKDPVMATKLERLELNKPFEQRTPVALLQNSIRLEDLPFEYVEH